MFDVEAEPSVVLQGRGQSDLTVSAENCRIGSCPAPSPQVDGFIPQLAWAVKVPLMESQESGRGVRNTPWRFWTLNTLLSLRRSHRFDPGWSPPFRAQLGLSNSKLREVPYARSSAFAHTYLPIVSYALCSSKSRGTQRVLKTSNVE